MAVNAEKLIVDGIDMATAFDITTGELYCMLDQITDGSIENGSEIVYGTGKRGVKLSAVDRNKTTKFSCNNGYIVGGALAAQVGAKMIEATTLNPLTVPDYYIGEVKAKATTLVLPHEPVGVKGAEVKYVYTLKNGAQDKQLTVDASPSAGKFKVDAATKTLTFDTSEFQEDCEVIVFYDRKAESGAKIENSQDTFSKSCRLVLDLTCRDVCDNNIIYHTKFVFPNVKIDGNFNISFGNEPSVHAFAAEAIPSICSKNKTLWEWYVVE